MPAFIASWECATLWPDRCKILEPDNGRIDHMISLGTGHSLCSTPKFGPHSPVRDRFPKRLLGNCMMHMDSENQWKMFAQCVPPKLHGRYHRLNVCFPGPEPAINEVQAIRDLKILAQQSFASDKKAHIIRDTMIASMFYFELDSFSTMKGGSIRCLGTIMCRLPLDAHGRLGLQMKLWDSASSFVVCNETFQCVETMNRKEPVPIFRRQLDFKLKNITDDVHIYITGITNHPTPISGLPRPLNQIIEVQGLIAPFGCLDHREAGRLLPDASLKRKLCSI